MSIRSTADRLMWNSDDQSILTRANTYLGGTTMTTIITLTRYLTDDFGSDSYSTKGWDVVVSALDALVTDLTTGHITCIPLQASKGYANGISLELTSSEEVTLSIDSVLYSIDEEDGEQYPDTIDEYEYEDTEGWK